MLERVGGKMYLKSFAVFVGDLIHEGSVRLGCILTSFLLMLLGSRIAFLQMRLIITFQILMIF